MRKVRILIGLVIILSAVSYGLAQFMASKGIYSVEDSRITAQEKIENQGLATKPTSR